MKNSLRKSLSTLGLSASVILGTAGFANAQSSTTTTSTKSTAASTGTSGKGGNHGNRLSTLVTAGTITQAQADAINAAFDAARRATGTAKPTTAPTDAERTAKKKAVLAPLVSAGTITQAQADAVVAAMPVGGGGHGGGGRGGMGGGGFAAHAATVAKALGLTEAELKTQMDAGKTIAQIATAKGVSLDTIVNAYLVEEQAEHPEATAADLKVRILDRLNGVKPARRTASSGTTSTTKAA